MKSLIIKMWRTMCRPAVHISLGVLTMGGFIAGVIFWGGFNTALEATNTENFASAVIPCVITYTLNCRKRFTGKTTQGFELLALIVTYLIIGLIRLPVKCKLQKKCLHRYLVTMVNQVFSKNAALSLPSTSGTAPLLG